MAMEETYTIQIIICILWLESMSSYMLKIFVTMEINWGSNYPRIYILFSLFICLKQYFHFIHMWLLSIWETLLSSCASSKLWWCKGCLSWVRVKIEVHKCVYGCMSNVGIRLLLVNTKVVEYIKCYWMTDEDWYLWYAQDQIKSKKVTYEMWTG